MKKGLTELVFILDRSGSMSGLETDTSMSKFTAEDIAYIADWANTLPRRLLGYRTPDELFDAELDRIYTL